MGRMKKEHLVVNGIEQKHCSRCNEWKPLEDFYKDNSKWDGLHAFCKKCTSKIDHDTYMKDPQSKYKKVLEYQRRTGRISRYHPYDPKYYSSPNGKEHKKKNDQKRRELIKAANAEHKITPEDIDNVKLKYNNRCAYCGKDCTEIYHIDHILPLCRGGKNNIENLALSCPRCNYRKRNKTDIEFIGHAV